MKRPLPAGAPDRGRGDGAARAGGRRARAGAGPAVHARGAAGRHGGAGALLRGARARAAAAPALHAAGVLLRRRRGLRDGAAARAGTASLGHCSNRTFESSFHTFYIKETYLLKQSETFGYNLLFVFIMNFLLLNYYQNIRINKCNVINMSS